MVSKKTPKFSVLISVYKNDNPEHLALALKSVYNEQTLKPNQVVIVCDGPVPFGIRKVIDNFSTVCKNTDIVKLPHNCGLGEALRVGSLKCKYDYIMRMDADDISVSDRFEKQISFLVDHPEIDVVGGNIVEFKKSLAEQDMRQRVVPRQHEEIFKMAKSRNPMNHVTVCIRKPALDKADGYKTCPHLEDYYLWLRMMANGLKLSNMPQVLVYVRVGNGFSARRGSRAQLIGRKMVQGYMLEHHMISRFQATKNIAVAYGLIYSPNWLKNLIYGKFLRTKAS